MLKKIKFIWFIVAMLVLVPTVLAKSTTPVEVTPEALAQGYHDPLYTATIDPVGSGNSLAISQEIVSIGSNAVLENIGGVLVLNRNLGNVGVGTDTAGSKLTVGGDIAGANIRATAGLKPGAVANSVTETGMIRLNGNYLEYYDGSSWRKFTTIDGGDGNTNPELWRKNSDNTIYYSTANVGIGPGSSAPGRTLDVYGTARFSGDTNVGGALSVGTDLTVTGNDILGSNGNALTFTAGGTTVANKLTVGTNVQVNGNIIQGSDGATRLTFANTGTTIAGNVAAGSGTITNNLQAGSGTITNNLQAGSGTITGTLSAGKTSISGGAYTLTADYTGSTSSAHALSIENKGTETAYIQADGTFSGKFKGDGTLITNAGEWAVGSDTTEIYNKNSGNVGIGTTNPSHKLEVVGDARIKDTLEIGNAGGTIQSSGLNTASTILSWNKDGDSTMPHKLTTNSLVTNTGDITSAGDIRINGGDIRNPSNAVKITLNSDGSVTISGNVKVTGDLEVQGNIVKS